MCSLEGIFCANVMKSLNEFRKEGILCDVTLSAQGESFPAHRNVLSANSEFFKALFANEMKENIENTVHMEEFEPQVMEQLLNYMYGGGITITRENALDLAIGSDFLFLTELKGKACEYLISDLNSENCLFLLYMAEKYNVRELRDSAQTHILENYVAVSVSEGFAALSIEQLLAIVSSDDLVAREEKIFESVIRWTKQDLETRKKLFPTLFSCIRLIYMARCYLINEVQEDDLVKNDESCLRLVTAAKEFFSTPKGTVQNSEYASMRPRACQTAILMVGGWEENSDITASSKVYMTSIKQIFEVSAMSTPRKNHGIAVHEGLVYVVGGTTKNGNVTRSAELYDPRTNTWSSLFSLRKEVAGVGVAMVGDYLYAAGGHDSKGMPQSIVQRYSAKLNKWECVASMNASRTRHCVVGLNYVYAFGGYSSNEDIPLKSAEYYNHLSDSWVDIAPMNQRRSDACAVCMGNKVYVIGGEDILGSPIKLASCEMYNPKTNRWTNIVALRQPRSHAGAVVVKDKVFVLGGVGGNNRELRSVECYDADQQKWQEVANLSAGIEGFGCCVITVPGELMPVLV